MGFVITSIATLAIALSIGSFYWRNAGPAFALPIPKALTVVETQRYLGEHITAHDIRFPNLLPLQWYTHSSMKPFLEVGDIIEINTALLTEQWALRNGDRSLRVDTRFTNDVSGSYFFYLNQPINFEEGVIRLVITGYDTEQSDTTHQRDHSGEWFWARQFYNAEVVHSQQ